MTKHPQEAADLATVRGDGDPSVIVVGENVVNDRFRASILSSRGLGHDTRPELVLLSEASLDVEVREQVLDVGLAVAAVACVSRDTLAEKLLDSGDEWVVVRKLQVRECDVGGAQAASQRRGVVGLWVRDVLGRDLFLPVRVRDLSLLEAVLGEIGVGPYCGAVAVQLGPVALRSRQRHVDLNLMDLLTYVPSWCAIVALSSIMETLSMTAHKQDLVHRIKVGISVQRVHDLSESLPLSSISGARTRVRLVDETKVDGSLHHHVNLSYQYPRKQHT